MDVDNSLNLSDSAVSLNPCFIDESFDTHESKVRNYIVSAGIFLGNTELGFQSFTNSGLKLGFKTSKLFKVSHQKQLHVMGNWLRNQDFLSLSVTVSLSNWDPEVARRLALTQLFAQLNLLSINSFLMDSRDNELNKKKILNSLDNSTLSFLGRLDSRFNNSRLTFHNDNSDFRFAIADFVAWCTRRLISSGDNTFYDYVAEKNEVFIIAPEKVRG